VSVRRHHIRLLLGFFLGLILSKSTTAQDTIYVNQTATGSNDGTSWTNAYTFLQDALQAAQSGDEVWVAQGVYRPDQGAGIVPGDREASFALIAGVVLYGGFSGNESSRDQRDWEYNPTILSGDLLSNDIGQTDPFVAERADNSFQIVRISVPTTDDAPTLDGFSISGGSAFVDGFKMGGGLFLDVGGHAILTHLKFRNNFACHTGGGMHSWGTFVLTQSEFENNAVGLGVSGCHGWTGGGLYHRPYALANEELATARVDDLIFNSNSSMVEGGALGVWIGPLIVSNTTFINNQGESAGAAYHFKVQVETPVDYFNVRFIGNKATRGEGGAISLDGSVVRIMNALFNGNKVLPSLAPTQAGGAVSAYEKASSLDIINSTFVKNSAPTGGAIWRSSTGQLGSIRIWNSIFWNNSATADEIFRNDSPYAIQIGNSIVEGGFAIGITGVGPILEGDPLFRDPPGADNNLGTLDDDYSLLIGSPGIDAGNNSVLPPDLPDIDEDGRTNHSFPADLLLMQRIVDGGSGTAIVDIGAYEYGAPPVVITTEQAEEVPKDKSDLLSNYPNPFSSSTTIQYSLLQPARVTLELYDILGKRVRVLEQGYKAAGEHSVHLDAADLSTGVYFVRLTAGESSQTRKVVVLR